MVWSSYASARRGAAFILPGTVAYLARRLNEMQVDHLEYSRGSYFLRICGYITHFPLGGGRSGWFPPLPLPP